MTSAKHSMCSFQWAAHSVLTATCAVADKVRLVLHVTRDEFRTDWNDGMTRGDCAFLPFFARAPMSASSAYTHSYKRHCDSHRISEHASQLETGYTTEGCGDPDCWWYTKRRCKQGRWRATRLCRLWTASTCDIILHSHLPLSQTL